MNNTGGPAFPEVNYKQPVDGGAHMMTIHSGMTLRDYFAAKAMQGMLAENGGGAAHNIDLAKFAYWIADAMLEARK